MKTFAIFASFMVAARALASQENPTKDELLATVRHIQRLAADQKVDLDRQRKQLEISQNALVAASDEAVKLQVKIDNLASKYAACQVTIQKQKAGLLRRDIIIGLLSLAIGIYCFLKFYVRLPFL